VTWSSTDADLVLQSPASGVSNAAGQVPIWATSLVSGQHGARAFVTVGGRSVEIVFTPQPQPPAPGPAPEEYQSSPFVYSFVAGPPCVGPDCEPEVWVPNDRRSRIVVEPDGQLANGQTPDVVHIFLFDRYGNPVSGQTIVQSTGDPSLIPQRDQIEPTDQNGQTTIDYTSLVDGGHDGRAYVVIDGLPVEINFRPQPVPPAPGPPPSNYQSSPFRVTFAVVPDTGSTVTWQMALWGGLAGLLGAFLIILVGRRRQRDSA
jgi:LPXTG-motif cell wall-anchored protein